MSGERNVARTPLSLDLTGKRAIVTAGGSGIGLVIAGTLATAGAKIHICDVNEELLAAVAAREPRFTASVADVSRSTAVDRMFDDAEQALGGLDILVNNAGIAGPTKNLEDISDEEWRQTVDVNLTGQFYCARRAIPLLKQAGGGSIVNLSSAAGLFGLPMRSPYVAAIFAVIGLTKTLAMELGASGIRVNAICPGSVEGDRMERVIAAESRALGVEPAILRQNYIKHTSLRTFVTAEDIAAMVLFVCSDAGKKISGQSLSVDGHTETLMARD
jgi:NAD(P)-dependent dehydrogenase (short-subunit alcohol dehydrogenase family)